MADISARLREVLRRYDELSAEMARPEVVSDRAKLQEIAREHAGIADLAERGRQWIEIEKGIDDARSLMADSGGDREMETLAKDEIVQLEARRVALLAELEDELHPRDPNDDKNVIV